MVLEAQLRDFFARPARPVLVDGFRFRAQLGLGIEAYPVLARWQGLWHRLGGVLAGIASYAAVLLSWGMTLGLFARMGVALGLVAGPHGLALLVASVAVAIYAVGARCLRTARRMAVVEVPNHISSPLPELARELGEVLADILLSACADSPAGRGRSRRAIERYLIRDWGYHPRFVRELLAGRACLPAHRACEAVARLRALAGAGKIGRTAAEQALPKQVRKMASAGAVGRQAAAVLCAALQAGVSR